MSNPANFKQSNPKRSRRQYKTRPAEDRFWEKVRKTPTCWLWEASKLPGGYGQFRAGRMVLAHRFSYELVNGTIPAGLQIDHLCRVRHCVNPDHMEVVTNRENSMRGISPSIRIHKSGRCAKGHIMTPENTYIYKKGWRECRECQRISHKQRRENHGG